jgi:ribosome biogenesis GTPase
MASNTRGKPKDLISKWLDDENSSSRQRPITPKSKKKKRDETPPLPLSEGNATVTEVYPQLCRVKMDQTDHSLLCSYRRASVFNRSTSGLRERSPVGVGDRVLAEAVSTTDGIVARVCERKNFLYRAAPGKEEGFIHVIAANLDRLVIVASAHDPDFSPGLVDRFLIAAQAAKIPTSICINKSDLLHKGENPWKIYEDLGIDCRVTSAKEGIGVDKLRKLLANQKVAFAGHSGVGKTSLLRALLGKDIGRIGHVSESTGKGLHTTTGAVLLEGTDGSQWIDTPGVRSFSLMGLDPARLLDFFPEIAAAGDRAESMPRYSSYQRIYESLESGEG